MKVKMLGAQSCLALCDLLHCSPPGSSVHGVLQTRILEWILQGIFPTQGLNPGFLYCRQILYHPSHQGIVYITADYRYDVVQISLVYFFSFIAYVFDVIYKK